MYHKTIVLMGKIVHKDISCLLVLTTVVFALYACLCLNMGLAPKKTHQNVQKKQIDALLRNQTPKHNSSKKVKSQKTLVWTFFCNTPKTKSPRTIQLLSLAKKRVVAAVVLLKMLTFCRLKKTLHAIFLQHISNTANRYD